MKFSREFLLVSLLVVVGGFLIMYRYQRVDAKSPDSSSESPSTSTSSFDALNKTMGGSDTPILVEAEQVVRGDLIQRVSAQGRVKSYQQVDLKNEVVGRLVKLHVRDGQLVKQGDLIAEIDDRDYRLALQDAEAKLLAAKADYLTYDFDETLTNQQTSVDAKARLAELKRQYENGDISKEAFRQQSFMSELQELKAGGLRGEVIAARTYEQARLASERAQIELEKCHLVAPFDGTVFSVSVAEGQLLSAQTMITNLVNLNDLAVKAKVLESEIGAIEKGRQAAVNFAALPSMGSVTGSVEAISPFVNVEDKTVDVIIRFPNTKALVKPGMFADVIVDSRIYENRIMVPKTAILPRDNRLVVFKISEDNHAKWEYVETGVDNSQFVEITKGDLKEGDLVLTNNHFTMGHDTLVKVAD